MDCNGVESGTVVSSVRILGGKKKYEKQKTNEKSRLETDGELVICRIDRLK